MRFSLKRNVLANYVSQFFVLGIGVVMAPIYLSRMGTEAYGLIGFFTVMGAWFQMLDMGLTPTLIRETARFRGGATDVNTLRSLIRALEIVFGSVSLAGAAAIILGSGQIATHWLRVQHLSIHEVSLSIALMGLSIPLRWTSGLYRGLISAFEHQVWLSIYNMAIATFRFIGVLGIFWLLGATPANFFAYQLVLAIVELSCLVVMTYSLIRHGSGTRKPFSWKPLVNNLTFSLILAFTASVWVALTQTDKLVLSTLLTLTAYGTFSIAVVAAGTVSALGSSLGQAVLPRLTKLVAEKDIAAATRLYRDATQAACILTAPVVTLLCFFAQPILTAWTAKPAIASQAAPILCLYAIGNGWVALYSFPYYLQYAKGDLRLHFIGNIAFIVLFIPAVFLAAQRYGAIGTGAAWAIFNGLYFLLWTPIVHARIFSGQHWGWMYKDIALVAGPTILMGYILSLYLGWPAAGRWPTLAEAGAVGCLLLIVASIGSSMVRSRILHSFRTKAQS